MTTFGNYLCEGSVYMAQNFQLWGCYLRERLFKGGIYLKKYVMCWLVDKCVYISIAYWTAYIEI